MTQGRIRMLLSFITVIVAGIEAGVEASVVASQNASGMLQGTTAAIHDYAQHSLAAMPRGLSGTISFKTRSEWSMVADCPDDIRVTPPADCITPPAAQLHVT